ncbi:MAG: FtsK/SpoIIIE domain-containing protein [Pirellulaceae bacterium]
MERITVPRQCELIEDLARLIAERAQTEVSVRTSCEARDATTNSQFSAERERLTTQFQRDRDAVRSQHNNVLAEVARKYERAVEKANQEHELRYRETVREAEHALNEAQQNGEAVIETLKHDHDQAVRETARKLHEFKEKVQDRRSELQELENQAQRILRRRRCVRAAKRVTDKQGTCNPSSPLEDYGGQVAAAKVALDGFRNQWAAALTGVGWLLIIFITALIAGMLVGAKSGYLDIDRENGGFLTAAWLIGSGAVALGMTAIAYVCVRPTVVQQTLSQYGVFQQTIANADKALEVAVKVSVLEADTRRSSLKRQHRQDLRDAEAELEHRREAITTQREVRLTETMETMQARRQAVAETRERKQKEVNGQVASRLKELKERGEQQLQQHDERHQRELATSRGTFQRSWKRLVEKWTSKLSEFQASIDQMTRYCSERFPDWDRADWKTWSPPDDHLPALRFGQYTLRLNMFEKGLPKDEDLRPARDEFHLPAVVSFRERPSLLMEAWGQGRVVANQALQNVMLRLLTSLPPAKVHFTIMDPVGLGQNFSAFMHLADYDDKLVNHRIWTETAHITKRLTDLTEHMEDVIQTYLRNEFSSIAEYNEHAGEVAEPFHILVVANFPAGFSDEAAQRLLSISSSGARCGVYTLVSTDGKLDLPRNFDLADLEVNASTLQWNGDRFCWLEEDLKDLPLTLDQPPNDDRMTEIIRTLGQRAKEASRVEVPFATVMPKSEDWWTRDSRGSIDVALGRAGASKLQELRLGRGTSQHVLISGKTGSGKSTLLHALITNVAVHYSPEEVEFYLIDFKKGVEFKPYAALKLPHARVVAIESEREFGMSVLERLDVELRRRGNLFRERGVQDVRSYRDAFPDEIMPRVLLIIDEFQEFFVQDDKLAQEAALLMDRLVRQGRAFGIHVMLGSQTLAGAYSLARSTIGQMAIRIALQCSEADSHLILSEDNTAARLLRRPGEAIYNDANGLFEGNHPFQIVWLPAREQEDYLRRLVTMADEREVRMPPAIVFEGNAAADPRQNELQRQAISGSLEPSQLKVPRAWLGAAVSIKEPTAAAFHRQSGANLLMVGQQEETAMGVLANCLISLAATSSPPGTNGSPRCRCLVFDGTRPDAPEYGFWPKLAHQLPFGIQVQSSNDRLGLIQEIAEEVARRQAQSAENEAPIFLLIYNLSRFRDLRRSDDDFGFSGFGEEQSASPSKSFMGILREGPLVGVHTLMWCDTFSNANRWFDRQTLRDLNHRVLFQMSATDSSNLMDSPAASRLGVHRAILYSEEQGQFEKFRPYGLPDGEWVAWVKDAFEGGVVRP